MVTGEPRQGVVYGLGAGPGDPELLTLKAHRILKSVDLVAYAAPVEGDSFARSIVAPYIADGQAELPIRMPMTVERFPAQEVYDAAAAEIESIIAVGRDVAVVCQGDPFLYGSFMYLFGRLAETCRVEVVPGVSSLTACAASAAHPLVSRNDVLTILPAPLPDEVLAEALARTDAAAIVKVGRHLARVRSLLDRLALLPLARYVERATLDVEQVSPLTDIESATAPYFATILVHKRGDAWRTDP